MAEEESPSSSVSGASPNISASNISQWIKNVAALVGVFGALVGIWLSIYQLREKAVADLATANANLETEKIKQQVAHEQLQAQQEQHNKDNEFARQTRQSDFEHQESAAHRQEAAATRENLSKVITRMLGNEANAEGDLAVLFNYVDLDPESREIVQNAVLARLEDPRSHEEVDLGFRLFERIGAPAIEATVQVNRSARRRYDDYLFAKFHQFAVGQGDKKALRIQDLKPHEIDSYEKDIVNHVSLDQNYVFATINRRIEHWAEGAYRLPKENSESKHSQLDMAMAVIERSNLALVNLVKQMRGAKNDIKPRTSEIDLSDTYLTSIQLNAGALLDRYDLNLDRAYLELDHPRDRQVPRLFDKAETSKMSLAPNSVKFESVGCALGHSNSQCESQGTLRAPQSLP